MRLRLLAAAAAAALAVAGCGGGAETTDDTATPDATATTPDTAATPDDAGPDDTAAEGTPAEAEPVVQAVDATIAEGSASVTTVVAVDSAEFSDRLESTGVVDFTGDRRQLDMTTEGGDVTAILSADGILLGLGDGAGWVELDPSALQGTPLEAYALSTIPLQDPSVNLALLRGATSDTSEGGTEDVDGESTTRYSVVVDVERAAAQADEGTRASLDAIAAQAGADATIPMEVWIDESDRIRRIEHRSDLGETALVETDTEGTIEVTIDLTDFGQEVTITEPDEGEIVSVDETTLRQIIQQATGATAGDAGTTGTDDTGTTGTDDAGTTGTDDAGTTGTDDAGTTGAGTTGPDTDDAGTDS
jgi:hypothetical protein